MFRFAPQTIKKKQHNAKHQRGRLTQELLEQYLSLNP